jgi:hypothetical protein
VRIQQYGIVQSDDSDGVLLLFQLIPIILQSPNIQPLGFELFGLIFDDIDKLAEIEYKPQKCAFHFLGNIFEEREHIVFPELITVDVELQKLQDDANLVEC